MSKLAVSVIIPVYEEKDYLSDCLDSLLKQDFKEDYDILLIETGSDDGSNLICQEYEKKYPGKVFWYHHPEKMGISMARNLGILHATGEYIAFIDGDDYVEEDYLSSLYEKTKEAEYNVITGGYFISENNKHKKAPSLSFTGPGKEVLKKLYSSASPKWGNFYCWGRLYQRSFLFALHLLFDPEINVYEDFLFNSEVLLESSQVCYFKKPIYHYRKHASSTMAQTNDRLTPFLEALERSKKRLFHRQSSFAKELFAKVPSGIKKEVKEEASLSIKRDPSKKKEILKEAEDVLNEIFDGEE